MARKSVEIKLTERHRNDLENLIKFPPNDAVAKRATIILECDKGNSNAAIADKIGMDAHYVAHWRKVYLEQGINGLYGEHGGGTKASIDSEQLRTMLDSLLADEQEEWTVDKLFQATGASNYMVSEALRKMNVNLQRQRQWSFQTENELLSKNVDVVGLYLSKEDQAFIVSSNPCGISNTNIHSGEFVTRNRLLSEELLSYEGTLSLSDVINTAAWHTKDPPLKSKITLSDYLKRTLNSLPQNEEYEYNVFMCSTQESIDRGNNFSNVYVNQCTKQNEWLAKIENWVISLGDRNKSSDSIDGLIKAIRCYLDRCRDGTNPLIWQKSFDTQCEENVTPEITNKDQELDETDSDAPFQESLENEIKAVLKKHLKQTENGNNDIVKCGFISFVYDTSDMDVCIVEGSKGLPTASDSDFEELSDYLKFSSKVEKGLLEIRNEAGAKAAENVLDFLKKKQNVDGLTKPAQIDGELGRISVNLPLHLEKHLHNGEILRTGGLLKQMCRYAIHSSYRTANNQLNHSLHRYEANCPIPLITYSDVVVRTGSDLIKATEEHAEDVLLKHGFGKDGLLPPDTPLPEELMNHPLECIEIRPAEIMREMNLELPPIIPLHVSEESLPIYSQPESGLHPRIPKRRSERLLIPDERRFAVLTEQVRFVNTLPDRPPGSLVLHNWLFEKHVGDVVHIFIDADLVSEQESIRVKGGKAMMRMKRTNIKHVEIRVETEDGGRFNITSTNLDTAYKELLAVLLENNLTTKYFLFFIDGENILFDAIEKYFKPWHHKIFLDFFHVQEKCENLLSSAIITKKVPSPWQEPELYVRGPKAGSPKKTPLVALSRTYASVIVNYLWYGNVDVAIDFVKHIMPTDIANQGAIDELITYLENKGKYITCYALRSRVGLKNSSNASELANELIVSARQKVDDRMHWIEKGSASLAALSALFLNEHEDLWFESHTVSFKLYYKNPTKLRESNKTAA